MFFRIDFGAHSHEGQGYIKASVFMNGTLLECAKLGFYKTSKNGKNWKEYRNLLKSYGFGIPLNNDSTFWSISSCSQSFKKRTIWSSLHLFKSTKEPSQLCWDIAFVSRDRSLYSYNRSSLAECQFELLHNTVKFKSKKPHYPKFLKSNHSERNLHMRTSLYSADFSIVMIFGMKRRFNIAVPWLWALVA